MNFNIVPCPDTIDYILLEGPEYRVTAEGFESDATYVCKSADLCHLIRIWYGLSIATAGDFISEPKCLITTGDTQTRTLRLWCDGLVASPFDKLKTAVANADALRIQLGADVKGVAGGTHVPVGARGIPACDYYKINAHFTDRDPFVEERFEHGGEIATISTTDLYFTPGGDGFKVDQETDRPLFVKTTGEWGYSVKRTKAVPDIVFSMRGKVNSEIIYSEHMYKNVSGEMKRQSFAVGTVLYASVVETPIFVPWGNTGLLASSYHPYWRLDYRFLINEKGWNKFPRTTPGTPTPEFLTLVTKHGAGYDPYTPYETADLRELLFNPKGA